MVQAGQDTTPNKVTTVPANIRACPVCHDLDRNKIIYWRGGPSRARMFRRYFNNSNFHPLLIYLNDLKLSASRECKLCAVVFEIFRWLARAKAGGLRTVYQAKVEICIPFESKYPVVLSYSWLPMPSAPIPREYDLQLCLPAKSKCDQLPWSTLSLANEVPSDARVGKLSPITWLQTCLQSHGKEHCKTNADGVPRSMPRRLIFLGDNRNQIRLVDDFGGKLIPYFALSYCWGPSQHIITNSANYDQHLRNIPWSALAATYRDAIDFTRGMGYRYLWIDALCIIQDDKIDWNGEASHMADIYSESVLVISAANASHVGFGFLHDRKGTRVVWNKSRSDPGDPRRFLVQEPTIHSNIIDDPGVEKQWPLFRRAWTLQEWMLATRVVHFTEGEMIWECSSMCTCECGHLETASPRTWRQTHGLSNLDRTTETQRASLWHELALSYQNRLLTKDKDRLSALSGLAHRFQSDSLGQYVAGLWTNFIISMMLWEVKKGRKTTEYVAPSWSWASIQGTFQSRLSSNEAIEANDRFQATLQDSGCVLASADPYGAIVQGSAYVVLSSPCADGTIVRSHRNGNPVVQLTGKIQAFLESDVDLRDSQIGGTVKCLFPRGLAPEPSNRYLEALVLSVSKNMNDYQRIGIAHIKEHSLREHRDRGERLSLAVETVRII